VTRPRRVLLVAVTAAAFLGGGRLWGPRPAPGARVVGVIDGDTVELARGDRRAVVRLLGVDAPETVHPERPVECFGPEAAAWLRRRLLGRSVRMGFDRERRDRYGRLLAHLDHDGRDVSEEMLTLGYARLLVVPPNGARRLALLRAELAAREAGRGLWAAC
jgi:micrococcal nuclease